MAESKGLGNFLALFYLATINTFMSSFAAPQDLINRYDVRLLSQLASDDGVPVSSLSLQTNPIIEAMLADATGQINLSTQVGQRYTQAELAALTGTDAAILVRLTCDLAFVYLCERRGNKTPLYEEAFKRSQDTLDRIKSGAEIFNVPSDVGAGNTNTLFPSIQNYQTVNTIRTATQNTYFPQRRQQNPALN